MILDLREIPTVWINLDSATKNAEAMEKKLKDHGFKYTYRKSACVIEPPENTHSSIKHYVGCGQSHLDILENKDYGTPLLILEDDAEFTEAFNPVMNIPDNADGVYLGISKGNVYYQSKRYNPDYLRIAGILATHAILYINEEYRKKMAEVDRHCIYNLKRPWDLGAAGLQQEFKVYTPSKPYFYQADNRDSANKWEMLTDSPLENRNSTNL
jgi:hypothetical protein